MIRRWLFHGFKLGIAVGALLVVALWVEHMVPVELPVPTGRFAVGRWITAWADGEKKRELMVWVWYPAAAGQSLTTEDYLPAPLRVEEERSRGMIISRLLTRDLSRVRVHSLRGADVSPEQRSYPVAILRAGASAGVANYTTIAEDLASHGYVVVGFDAPYRTQVVVFPDGRVMHRTAENNVELCAQDTCVDKVLRAWIGDCSFALDALERLNASDPSGRFTGRLDMTRVGVAGHSFGGATALQFCREDSRCKAGIDLDGQPFGSVIREGLRQPFLFVLSDQIHASDPETRRVLGNIQSIYDHLPRDGRLRVLIRGANHFLFSDDGALLKSHIVMGMLRLLGVAGIEGRRQLAVTTNCVHRFFDAHLRGAQGRIGSQLYPEIEVLP